MFFHPIVWQCAHMQAFDRKWSCKAVIWHQDCNAKTPSMVLSWVTSSSAWAHKFHPPHEHRFSVPVQFYSAGDDGCMEKDDVPNAQASWATSRDSEDTGRQSGQTQHSLQEPAASYLNRWEKEESSPSAASPSSHRTDSTAVLREHGDTLLLRLSSAQSLRSHPNRHPVRTGKC